MLLLRDSIKLIISDVSDTLAEVYSPIKEEISHGLAAFLNQNKYLFVISGHGVENIFTRIINHLPRALWNRTLVGACSGTEVWGFDNNGPLPTPFFSIYEQVFCEEMKRQWRSIIKQIIREYRLEPVPTMTVREFIANYSGMPNTIMYEDRGSQITFEMLNAVDLSDLAHSGFKEYAPFVDESKDLRISIIQYANSLFETNGLPIQARLAGNFAIDFAIRGVTKATAIREALFNGKINDYWNFALHSDSIADTVEIWGDKFSAVSRGTDLHMIEAFPCDVRAIDFGNEPKEELPEKYNILLWDGNDFLCDGVIEYMKRSRLL